MWGMTINPVNPWEYVWKDMKKKMDDSGLTRNAKSVEMHFTGTHQQHTMLAKAHRDIKVTQRMRDRRYFEWATLNNLWQWAMRNPNDYILYLHGKGVTRREKSVEDWRNLMLYFNVERWRDCVKKLDEYDAVGVNLTRKDNKPYFAGNMWWTKGEYIKKLSEPKKNMDRLAAEFWIGSGKGNFYSMHNSRINHYKKKYPDSIYRK